MSQNRVKDELYYVLLIVWMIVKNNKYEKELQAATKTLNSSVSLSSFYIWTMNQQLH